MIYANYGNTGIDVSKIGFGGMRFDISKSIEENAALVRYAYEKGINYFDTAPAYCKGKSEKIFGAAFSELPGRFYVSTKLMPSFAPTAGIAAALIKHSINKMHVEKIDFMHIWCVRTMEQYAAAVKKGGLLDGILKMKQEGLVGHVAMSLHLSGKYIKDIIKDERLEGILIGLNIFNYKYRIEGAKAAHEKGLGVAVMNPLGGGFIPANTDALKFLAVDGFTPVQNALRFAASLNEVSTVLVGFSEKEHIDAAVAAVEGLEPGNALVERFAGMPEINLEGACTACGYCNECPKDIYIPAYMQVYNNKLVLKKSAEQLKKDLKSETNFGGVKVKKGRLKDCIACGKCEKICTQHIPIAQRLKEMAEW
jgi:predicted aldo/keto reductase-like oxidoreductase